MEENTTGAQTLVESTAEEAQNAFLSGFEESDRAYLQEKGYRGPADLLAAAKNADKFAGVDLDALVPLPGEKATDEERAAFYARLGRPESAEGYKLPGSDADGGAFAKAIAPVLFDAGISQAQAERLAEGYNAYAQTAVQAAEEAYQTEQNKQMQALKEEWGADYVKNEELAKQAARKYGLEEQELGKLERALGSGRLMKFMLAIGQTTMDAPVLGRSGADKSGVYTPQEARAKVEALTKDAEFGKKFLVNDPAAIKLFNELTDAAAGGNYA